jgi:hypothetical protein
MRNACHPLGEYFVQVTRETQERKRTMHAGVVTVRFKPGRAEEAAKFEDVLEGPPSREVCEVNFQV